jgi:AbrB family looped-hinge helix DNA binding protein
MPITFERAVFATGGSLRVNIPAAIATSLGIKDGDTLVIGTNDHQIVMEKKKGK